MRLGFFLFFLVGAILSAGARTEEGWPPILHLSEPRTVTFQSEKGTATMVIPKGKGLRMVGMEGGKAWVEFAGNLIRVPLASTDYEEQKKLWKGVGPEEFFSAKERGHLLPGMVRAQVEAIWGRPSRQTIVERCEIWHYDVVASRMTEVQRFEVRRGPPEGDIYVPGRVLTRGPWVIYEPGYRRPSLGGESFVSSRSEPQKVKVGERQVKFSPEGQVVGLSEEKSP
jgi:hypothetical protein